MNYDDAVESIAREYVIRCNEYDRVVCGNAQGQPSNSVELGKINRHSSFVIKELRRRASAKGVD